MNKEKVANQSEKALISNFFFALIIKLGFIIKLLSLIKKFLKNFLKSVSKIGPLVCYR